MKANHVAIYSHHSQVAAHITPTVQMHKGLVSMKADHVANQSQTPSTGGRPNHTQSPDAQGAAIRLDQQNRSNQFASTAEDGRDAIRTDRDGSRLGKYTVFSYFDGRGEFSIDTVVYYLIRITMFLCSLIIVMSQLSNIMRDMMV